MPKTQSAYRKYHSTETAVTRVYNDLLLAADRGQVSALCLLDLTAAFDTVDHELLLLRLERQFGLRAWTALMWFRSYLSGRTYRVVYAGGTSSVVYIVCSVPQGSVLGPVLFVLYVADLADIVNRHGVTHSLVCRWHAVVPALLPWRHHHGSHSAQGVHRRCWSLDVR